jgi:hypothetical protein
MKKFKIISIFTLGLILLGPGCSEDFLKPEPLSFYEPGKTFTTPESLNSALIACLRNARIDVYGDTPPFLSENTLSEVAIDGTTDKTGPMQDWPAQLLPDTNLDPGNDWTKMGKFWTEAYNRIKYANTVISRINTPTWTSEAQKNNILGKAYIHRARTYYHLVHHYGDVPLILEEITSPRLDFYSVSRESILQKCKKDLTFATQWVQTEAEGSPIGDINKATAYHVLAQVNLALGDFDGAIAAANAVINDGWHKLMTDRFGVDKANAAKDITWDLHQDANKALPENRERIYIFTGSELLTEDGASTKITVMRQAVPFWGGAGKIMTPSGVAGMSDAKIGTTIGKGKVEIDQVTKYGRGIGRQRATPYLQYDIWDDPKDQRHNQSNWMTMEKLVYNHPNLKADGDPNYGKNLQKYGADGGILCTDTIRSWYNWPHYKLYVADPSAAQPQGGYADWYVYRLAETYLLRAEAYWWKNSLAEAAADVNAVRTRAGCDPYTPSQINLGTILDERARELYYEEFRNVELTRMAFIFAKTGKASYSGKTYNMANFTSNNFWYDRVIEKNVFYRLQIRAPHYNYKIAPHIVLWPVPTAAISANSLGHINQTKGYPGADSNIPPLTWKDGPGEGIIE